MGEYSFHQIVIMLLYMLLEYWLGSSKKVEANSVLELIIQIVKLLLQKLF